MKKILSLLLAIAIIVCAIPFGAFTFTASAATEYKDGYYTYTVSNGEATITDVNTSISGNVTIPSTLGGYTVTVIDRDAFYDCYRLTSITIPDSVTSIGLGAFKGCDSLTRVYITDIVAWCNIDFEYAFESSFANPLYYAKNLYLNGELVTDLVIPDSVTSIGSYAFYGCDSLTSITIPDSVTSIGNEAFGSCDSLTSVYITDIVAWCNIDFVDSSANPLYYAENLYLNGELVTDLVIPDSVTSIGSYAFCGCDSLTSITIPDSVTSMGNEAFGNCYSLKSVIIPDSVTSIGYYAFYRCTSLTSVKIGNGVTSIGYRAFSSCTSLTSITIGNSVTSIGEEAFKGCDSLTSVYITDIVAWCNIDFEYSFANPLKYAKNLYLNGELVTDLVIPDSVASIGAFAFHSCDSLTSITIPDSVASIGAYAFYNCNSIINVYYSGSYWERLDITIGSYNDELWNATWHYDDPEVLEYSYNRENLTASIIDCAPIATVVNIPKTVKKDGKTYTITGIMEKAFYDCYSLTSITIPDSVKSIGVDAFYKCNSLQKITLPFVGQNADGTGFTNFGYIFGADDESYPEYYNADYVPSSLKEVIVTGSTNIDDDAFYGCKYITSVSFTGNIKLIGGWAFNDCNGLKKVMLPSSLKTIRSMAFYDCINLTDVYYGGNSSQRDDIDIESGNDLLKDAAWHYNYGKITYPDVSDNAWYTESVEYVSKTGIMSGYQNGKFGTSDSIQRQDFLVMLARYEGVDLSKYNYKSKFSDVARGSYYEAAVNWGAENGIVTGYNNGKFGVGDKVTREQLVTFLYRYAKYKGIDTTCTTAEKNYVKNTYSDYKNVSSFAQEAIIWAVTYGVIGGKTPTTIVPQGNAQRCEVAKIMYNIYLNDIFK